MRYLVRPSFKRRIAYAAVGALMAAPVFGGATPTAAAAQLTITKTASPNPVTVGGTLTYTITVTNNTTVISPNTIVTDPLPGGVSFVSATTTLGSCSQSSGTVTCSLGSLAAGSPTVTITIVVTPTTAGPLSNTATATGFEVVGASATATTTVQGGNACPATPGFWKTHSSNAPGNQQNLWPISALTLGSHTYTEDQLIGPNGLFTKFKPSNSGDASMILAYQLFAAKLNVLSGTANAGSILGVISQADALLTTAGGSSSLPYNISPSSALGAQMVAVASQLDAYNNSAPSGCTQIS